MKGLVFAALLLVVLVGCNSDSSYIESSDKPSYYHRSMKQLTDVIVHDIFSPPVASRIYAYSSIAGYEVMAAFDDNYRTLAGQLNALEEVPSPDSRKVYSMPVAAVNAFLQTGRTMIFSEQKIVEFEAAILEQMKTEGNIPQSVYDRSIEYGKAVSDHILAWADKDNYKQTRTFPKYSLTSNPSKWQPTPPDYMEGIEPHWREIRPFVLDSAQQFVPQPPTDFSAEPGSQFYKDAMVVYEAVEGEPELIEVAEFWDCNPYVSHHRGHVMFATKKITPGGHWIGITAQACRQAGLDFGQTTEVYARASIALADGFISCWDEKYRSNLVRPETYINKYIDPEWAPALQTPPFPEHTSGHSVISAAAGTVLTDFFGPNFAFADSVEVEYGLPVRSFDSFEDAYSEAAISRLYGGIHYMPAIDYGVEQGEAIGELVINRLQTRVE